MFALLCIISAPVAVVVTRQDALYLRRECREKAQGLIKNASTQLKAAKDALASAQAAEMNAEQALSAAGPAVLVPTLCRIVAVLQ